MNKIPTLFERDWNGDPSRVINQVHPGCEWVIQGDGIATRKLDGTCCLVRNGALYKRREVHPGQEAPSNFEELHLDLLTGERIGWVPVGGGPEDKYHREAFGEGFLDGTYELVGPKVQGNREGYQTHKLISHNETGIIEDAPRTFEDLRDFLSDKDIEGIVFHHPDGRMAKIKLRDFGHRRAKP